MNNPYIQARRKILKELYDRQASEPPGAVELDDLTRRLNLPSNRVRSSITYLADPERELVQIRNSPAGGGRVYQFARITAAGIDLIEEPSEFNARFPALIVYQNIAGDKLEVTIGDNASEVTVGKDIFKVQFGAGNRLEEVTHRLAAWFKDSSDLSTTTIQEICAQLAKLIELLKSEDFDLGEVQRIKQFLLECEGSRVVNTAAFFSHPEVTANIQRAVEKLIGHF